MAPGKERCLPLKPVPVDPYLVGELWTLATPDGGESWLVGGRDLGGEPASRAVVFRSPDGGSTWRALSLPGGLGWLRQMAFSEDGFCGVAVGEGDRGGGFVLLSRNGGRSWRALDGSFPPLRAVAVLGEGFLVGGDQGFLGRGWCDGL
jgi:hypothetical protein